jgi:acetyltransferase
VALRSLFNHARMLRQLPSDEPQGSPPEEDLTEFFAGKHGFLNELEAKRVLRAYRIRTPREELASNEEEALQAAFRIGWPVVLKVHSAQVAHKTEAGGVELAVSNEEALRQAYRRILANVQSRFPDATVEGILVAEMISGAVAEVIVGISTDPDYGPVVAFGLGGILVELLKDASLRIPPISSLMAEEMIGEIQGAPLLKGFRGKPGGDLTALVDTLVQVGRLATDWSHAVRSLDINPLLVLPDQQGVIAVDSLIELR